MGEELGGGLDHVAPAGPVCLGYSQEHAGEAGHPPGVHGRKVGPAVEGLTLGGQEHGHGPAAAARKGLDGVHVDAVQVRPLLPVHLDVDVVLVHYAGDLVVLEGLALHDVAPVAGRVADAQQDGLVLVPGPLEGLLTPRVPVHGVVGVLEEVGAGLVYQAVGHLKPLSAEGARGGQPSSCGSRGRTGAPHCAPIRAGMPARPGVPSPGGWSRGEGDGSRLSGCLVYLSHCGFPSGPRRFEWRCRR